MIDSHTHLNLPPLSQDVDAYLEHARTAGVTGMMIIGVDLQTSRDAIELAQKYPELLASIGIHPEEAGKATDYREQLTELLKGAHVSAIGECGLDYKCSVDHQAQKTLFQMHVYVANEQGLPLIIHCRDAYDDLLPLLKKETIPKFVLHCASGPVSYIEEALSMGAYVSFAGNVTYPSAHNIRDILKVVPMDRLLVETDAPFLAPQPHRGQMNEPAFVTDTARFIAEFLGKSYEEIDTATTANAKTLFGF